MTGLMSGLVTDVFDVCYNLLAVKQSGSFLEGLALSLDEEEEDVDEFEEEPAAIDNVLERGEEII